RVDSLTCGLVAPQIINVQGAGTAMRFLTAYFAQCEGANVVLTGIERMKQRPIAPLVDALRALGADISYMEKEGCPPLHIRGQKLHGDAICVDGSISSQYVSALLMIAPMTGASRLTLTGRIVSRPYIEMTRALMARFGVQTTWEDEHTLLIPSSTYHAKPLAIEGDWSAASYWLAFEALARQQGISYDITLNGLTTPSLQGDSVCAEFFNKSTSQQVNKSTSRFADRTQRVDSLTCCHVEDRTQRVDSLTCGLVDPIIIDFTDCPDLVQTMAVAYCLLGKPFVFTGTESLRIKETDRIAALITELGKLGYELHYEDGTLKWEGNKSPQVPKSIATYNDHRMAMAFALAAMTHDSVLIENPEVVSKSYPSFWDDLSRVGFKVEEIKG
ncbi:MAG: 3-phosphoshikimate 1-carboxyvinyltransferase, partial [Bacteroidaceae bacterium]|nr:3-phosphoshikimate 1-carboxyvinyltransferase [Bacteroidaceae bacterium]